MRGCWLVVVVAACSGTSQLEDGAQSGTRLRLEHWTAGGTETLAAVMFDTQLGVHCKPLAWPDGTTYCTPIEPGADYAPIVYADAGCKQPLVLAAPGCAAPLYAARVNLDSGMTVEVATVGAPSAALSKIYTNVNGNCFAQPVADGASVFALGPDAKAADLVAMTLGSAHHGSGRLQWQDLESADGARRPAQLFDRDLGVACAVSTALNGDMTCAPFVTPYSVFYYRDAACTDAVFETTDVSAKPALVMAGLGTFRKLGDEIQIPALYGGYPPSSCAARTAMPGSHFFALGAAMTAAAVTRVPGSTSRIAASELHGTDIRIVEPGVLYDHQLDDTCTPSGVDATLRCMRTGDVALRYRDIACTMPAEVYEHVDGRPLAQTIAIGSSTCRNASASLFDLGTSLGEVFDKAGPSCFHHMPPGGEAPLPAQWYTLGTQTDVGAFVEVTSTTD